MRQCPIEIIGMGTNNTGYPGAFPPAMQKLIKGLVSGNILHLFSGSSLIGGCRIDLKHPNATDRVDVRKFIDADERIWDWVLLDPAYSITKANRKLARYAESKALSSDVPFRRKLKKYLIGHTENILWLDFCAPMIPGFQREKLWLVLPGGFHSVRILSWLKKEVETEK